MQNGGSSTLPFVLALAATVMLALAGSVAAVQPRRDDPVAIVSWTDDPALLSAIAAAGGSAGARPRTHVTIALPGGRDFASRMRGQGYWLLLDARSVLLCLPAPHDPERP